MKWRQAYSELGIDAEAAIRKTLEIPISVHCWQADDVRGLEGGGSLAGSGLAATGNFPGSARNGEEIRSDLDQVLKLVPGTHRVNIHALYAEFSGQKVDRDALEVGHFSHWIDWAQSRKVGIDFNPSYFAHPKASDGFTLSHCDEAIRKFWIRHGQASRKIAAAIGKLQGSPCVNNHWIPDGLKDSPADRWAPRERLRDAYDEIFAAKLNGDESHCLDAVEPKLFGIGSEDFVVGSFEFYASYALSRKKMLCLDMGHFHPTESVHDKVSALLPFHDRLLIHTSRPIRWDSDHVVIFNDDVRQLFLELQRGKALSRMNIALDYFDASINRLFAYVVGIRATRKALLYALLDPSEALKQLESEGKGAQKLALMERMKTMPFGEAWDQLCETAGTSSEAQWVKEAEKYTEQVLQKRS